MTSNIKRFLLCSAITFCCMFIIQFSFAAFISIFIPDMNPYLLTISDYTYMLLITFVLVRIFDLKRLYYILFDKNKIGYIIFANILLITLITSFYFKSHIKSFINDIMYFCFAIIILVTVNLLLLHQSFTISKKDEQLQAYNDYMPMLNELILSVRARQHNHTNEIQAIIGLMYTHTDYDSLTSAMSDTLDMAMNNKEPDYLLRLNMLLVSGFLYQKYQYAHSIGRDIVFDFHTYELYSVVPEYQLIKLFGILIDNALEAVETGDKIFVTVNSFDNKVEFTTKNSGWILSQADHINFFKNGYTRKKEFCPTKNHSGLGLNYLFEIVFLKYNGEITLWNEGSDILVKILV